MGPPALVVVFAAAVAADSRSAIRARILPCDLEKKPAATVSDAEMVRSVRSIV
jgi:hypothetical protein